MKKSELRKIIQEEIENTLIHKEYISPQDFYGGEIKKGDILIPSKNKVFYKSKRTDGWGGAYLPIEIVKDFEESK